VKVVWINYLSI